MPFIVKKSIVVFFIFVGLVLTAPSFATDSISVDDLATQIDAGTAPLILDVRSEQEFQQGHVPNAQLIPHTEISQRLGELESHRDQPIIIYCQSGRRAKLAVRQLRKEGFKQIILLEGSYQAWKQADHRIE